MKPILFSTPMVQAILADRKTMTRRVVKNKDIINAWDCEADGTPIAYIDQETGDSYSPTEPARYQIGDILWVRETWYYENHMHDLTAGESDLPDGRYSHRYVYRASSPNYPVNVGVGQHGWHPSIHMPREAARIFLRVTNVRVERLQNITPHAAWLEGCRIGNSFSWLQHIPELQQMCRDQLFRGLWDSLNAKRGYSWDSNPWVWVYSFERTDATSKVVEK